MKEDYLEAMRAAGFAQVEVVGESGYDFGNPTPDQVARLQAIDPTLTAKDIKVAAGSVASVKVSANKPL